MKKPRKSPNKLVSVVRRLSARDVKRCEKFLRSPYFNSTQELEELFTIIFRREEENLAFDKEAIWKALQPGRPYNDVRFRKYCSDLYKLIETFLVQEELQTDQTKQKALLMKAVERRNIRKLSQSIIRNFDTFATLDHTEGSSRYLHNYLLQYQLYHLARYELYQDEISNIEQINESLDFFYLTEKLYSLCAAISRKSAVVHDYNLQFEEEIVGLIERNSHLLDNVSIAAYFYIYRMLTDEDNEAWFDRVKSILNEHALQFSQHEAARMYTYALNYCSRRINRGRKNFVEEMFLIYRDSIEKEVIFEDGILNPGHFKNVITVGLRLRKYDDWIKSFIHEYSVYLPERSRDNAVTYNLATLYFYQKKHREVLELLREVEYEDITYNLNAKTMLLATYYETDEVEALFSLLESFRAYLNRHKDIPDSRRRLYQNLIKYTRKLANIIPGDKAATARLRAEVENDKAVASLNWLMEKIAELEGRPVGTTYE